MNRHSKVFYLFLLFCFFGIYRAQAQYNIDSLKKVIVAPKIHDTTKLTSIKLLLDNVYDNADFDRYNALMGKIAYKNSQQNTSLKKKYLKYLGNYYSNVSVRQEEEGNPKSMLFIDKAIKTYKEASADNELNAALISKGLIYYRKKEYKKAISNFYAALKYFDQHKKGNEDNLWYIYLNLGVVYSEQGYNKQAVDFHKKAIFYINQKPHPLSVEDELQKCTMYLNEGFCNLTLNQYDEAARNLNASLLLSRKHKDNSLMGLALGRLGMIEMKKNNYDEAQKLLEEAEVLSENDFSKGLTLTNLGEVYFKKKKYKKAEITLNNGLLIAKTIGNIDLIERIYQILYQVTKESGQYQKSLSMLELFHQYKDSSKVMENRSTLKEQQLKFAFEKRELKYKLENERKNFRKNVLLVGLLFLIVLIIVGTYFLYKNYKQKQAINQLEKNELKQKLLLTQMNPHFIFNSIDNIQSLIYNKQDKDAINYLGKFSKLTRQILEHSTENYITLEEEITLIENYLSIQQLLYNNKFDFQISVDETIEPEAILLPPMLIQPFVENAIKHGLKGKASQGKIKILFEKRKELLHVEIIDNGEGFREEKQLGTKKSLAMKITKERLGVLLKNENVVVHHINIVGENNKIMGAKVYFEIPYIYEN